MRHLPILSAFVLATVILLAAAVGYVSAQKEKPSAMQSPIVAAVPIQSETRYATDAFGRGELRDSVTQVTKVLIVRANGEMERKSLK